MRRDLCAPHETAGGVDAKSFAESALPAKIGESRLQHRAAVGEIGQAFRRTVRFDHRDAA